MRGDLGLPLRHEFENPRLAETEVQRELFLLARDASRRMARTT
jgi:hypothetical protein